VIKNLEGESDGLEADLVRLRQSGGGDRTVSSICRSSGRAVLAFAISNIWRHKLQGNNLHKILDRRLKGIQPEPIFFCFGFDQFNRDDSVVLSFRQFVGRLSPLSTQLSNRSSFQI
jgi:hypothetical protein